MRVQCIATVWSGDRCSRFTEIWSEGAVALCGIHRAVEDRGKKTRRVSCVPATGSVSVAHAGPDVAPRPGTTLLEMYGWSPKRDRRVRVRSLRVGDVYLDEENLPVLVERLSFGRVWGRYIWQNLDDEVWFNEMKKHDFVWLAERASA